MHSCILSVSHLFICPFCHFIYSFIHSAIKLIFLVFCAKYHSELLLLARIAPACTLSTTASRNRRFRHSAMSVFWTLSRPSLSPCLCLFLTLICLLLPFRTQLNCHLLRGLNTSLYTPPQYPDFFYFFTIFITTCNYFFIFLHLLYLYSHSPASSTKAGTKVAFTFECWESTVHCTKLLLSEYC